LLVNTRGMDLFETIKARRSVRAFQPREIETEKLNSILGVMMQAPSAGNLQAFKVYVVRSDKQNRELAEAALNQDFLSQAPVVLVFCADRIRSEQHYRQRGEALYSLQDATIATAYAQLAATAYGLATCWMGAFNDAKVAKIVGAPDGMHPVAMLPMGYPAEEPKQTPRRAAAEVVSGH
jgi:nitroreductase